MSANDPNQEAKSFIADFGTAAYDAGLKLPGLLGSVLSAAASVPQEELKATFKQSAEEISTNFHQIRSGTASFSTVATCWYNVGAAAVNVIRAASTSQSMHNIVEKAVEVVEPFAKVGEKHKVEMAVLSGALIVAAQSAPLVMAVAQQSYVLATDKNLTTKKIARSMLNVGGTQVVRSAVPKVVVDAVQYAADDPMKIASNALHTLGTVAAIGAAGVLVHLAKTVYTTPGPAIKHESKSKNVENKSTEKSNAPAPSTTKQQTYSHGTNTTYKKNTKNTKKS